MNTALATAAMVLGAAGLASGVLALRTLARLRQSVALLSRGPTGRETILDLAEKHMAASDAVRTDILELQRDLAESQARQESWLTAERAELSRTVQSMTHSVGTALRRVALVRYDAFDDLGGRLSFSLAILDDNGTGITLTSIASPSDTRLYAKSVTAGVADRALSPEEQQAIHAALPR